MPQAFVVVGGLSGDHPEPLDSVITLLPDASSWTELVSLPTPLTGARASIVGGNIRLVDFFSNNIESIQRLVAAKKIVVFN